jgi:hypothetical protein
MFEMLDDARTSLEKLAREYEPALLDGPDAVRVLRQLAVIRRITDGLIAKTTRRIEETKEAERNRERDAATGCANLLGTSITETRHGIQTAKQLDQNPVLDDAVRNGDVTVQQAGMIANATDGDTSETRKLLELVPQGNTKLRDACLAVRAARETDKERSARHRRSRTLRMWTGADGMLEGRFSLRPESGGRIKTIIDAGVRRRFRQHRKTGDHEPLDAYAADELCELLLSTNAITPAPDATPARKPPFDAQTATHIVIDFDVLIAGNHLPGKRCEIPGVGPVNVEWVRNILGDTFLTAIITRGTDITTVAHFGRTINAKLRTALLVQGHECVVCGHRGYLEIDHQQGLADGGTTCLHNLGPLCWICHHRKNLGWTLSPPDPNTRRRTLTPPARARPHDE